MIPTGMGFASMNTPSKYLESLILDRKLNHGGNPVLRWNMSNCMVKQDPAGNLKPDKNKATQKIDGIVSLILALDRVVRHEEEKPSVYEGRGIISI
jgi:phage terminase large subunit-like protein